MKQWVAVRGQVQDGEWDKVLAYLYPAQGAVERQRERYLGALDRFGELFGAQREVAVFSAPGRTEIGGNHTDHQRGCVVAASVDLDILAVASPNQDNLVRIQSEGYPRETVDLSDLSVHPEEKNRSTSLIRGVAARLQELGYQIGGFDAYLTSDVLGGSGLSSSAAYEVMLGTLFSHLFNHSRIDPVQVAQVGQYAENVYFGKPCGLLDQTACAVGGYVSIDFYNPQKPVVEKIEFDFASCGHTMCIVDAGGSHADLTDEYAAIPAEMKSVAAFFHKEVLREVPAQEFYDQLGSLRGQVSDRAILRAYHFFAENLRAQEIAQALREKDFQRFRALSTASGQSSFMYLQNVFVPRIPQEQCLSVALAEAQRLLEGQGCFRVHGGGFGGTIQVFVPTPMVERFRTGIEKVTGPGSCHLLSIRPVGGVEVAEELCPLG